MIKDYVLTPQEREDYCVCSVLQAIFRRHGINISQREIADKLTPDKHGFHPNDKNMRTLIESNGFSYVFYWRNEVPFNESEMALWEMESHAGFIGIKTHVYLFKDYKPPQVKVINPENGSVEVMSDLDLDR